MHISKYVIAAKIHREMQNLSKLERKPCELCGGHIVLKKCQWAHVLPICHFALFYKPGSIDVISLCHFHHRIFDDIILKEYFRRRDWANSHHWKRLEPNLHSKMMELVQRVISTWEDLEAADFPEWEYEWPYVANPTQEPWEEYARRQNNKNNINDVPTE